MLLEFYTKHPKMLILTCILAVFGLYNVIIASIGTGLAISRCNDIHGMVSILCYFLGFT